MTLRAEITRVVSEIRFSIFDLRHDLAGHSLAAALADYAKAVAVRPASACTSRSTSPAHRCRHAPQTKILRIAQEAIGNVRSHAQATNLWVTLRSDGSIAAPRGRGRRSRQRRAARKHWGLQPCVNARTRIGAELEMTPRPPAELIVTLRSAVDHLSPRSRDP